MTDPMIQVNDLCIGWGDVTLIKDANYEIAIGTCFGILGGSGCGKSTMVRHLIGLEQPKGGSIHIDGFGTPRLVDGRPPFGMMFQSGALFGSMTLLQNCLLPLQAWVDIDRKSAVELAMSKLALVSLDDAAHKLPGEISGGMKKRAGIARALMLEPDLLFLDEPSAGLDPIAAVELDDTINLFTKELGMTVVVVTHELPSIFRIVDQCIVLQKEAQGIVAQGDPRELRDHSEEPFTHHFFNRKSPTHARGT